MNRRLLLLLPLLGFLVLAGFLYKGLFLDPRDIGTTMIGKPLPEFSLQALDDPTRSLSAADFKGQPALLNFWATWCPTCRAEHQMLNRLSDQGVLIYGVNYKETGDALRWLSDLGNPYKLTVADPQGSLGINLGVYGAPETFLIDKDGVVRHKYVGAIDEVVWREQLAPLYRELLDEAGR